MTDRTLIQTYVLGYFVSTIYRQSSAAFYPSMYYETIVWEWDPIERKRGAIVTVPWEESRYRAAALVQHARVCAHLAERTPEFDIDDEEEEL